MESLFFELLKVARGQQYILSYTPTAEQWKELYAIAEKQAVLGISFHGVELLHKRKQTPPQELLFEWIGVSEQIKKQNLLAYKRSAEITKMFADAGFKSCILKGQGNALMYNETYSRTSGDIDIWVSGKRDEITQFVKKWTPGVFEQYHHIDFPIFKDIPVEVHYTPGKLLSPMCNRRFQKFCKEQMARQMSHKVELPDGLGEISVPTTSFNVVFQMSHIMNHFFIEGIGLRHFVDYFYVLKKYRDDYIETGCGFDENDVVGLFKDLGLFRFAKGVMWIEKECLGLEDKYLLVTPDERKGRVILTEILEGGNFGHHDNRYKSRNNGYIARGATDIYRLIKLASIFPSASFWKIYRKIENQRWKMKN